MGAYHNFGSNRDAANCQYPGPCKLLGRIPAGSRIALGTASYFPCIISCAVYIVDIPLVSNRPERRIQLHPSGPKREDELRINSLKLSGESVLTL